MSIRFISPLLFAGLLVGCGPRQEQFFIALRNQTSEPLTIGLAKEAGGPYEYAWATPEEAAMEQAVLVQDPKAPKDWGIAVPAGKEASAGPIPGKFGPNARPFLRVYRGDLMLSQIVAISRDSSNRIDLPLRVGENRFEVTDRDGTLVSRGGGEAVEKRLGR